MTVPRCQPDITLVQDLHMDADMLKDGYQKNLTELWHSDVVREAAKNALRAADRIEELTKALETARKYCDENLGPSRSSLLSKIAAVIDEALALPLEKRP